MAPSPGSARVQVCLKDRECKISSDLAEHAAQYLDVHGRTPDTVPNRPVHRNISSATPFAAYSGGAGQMCLFWYYQHATSKCRKAKQMTVSERRDRLIRAGACFWYLEPPAPRGRLSDKQTQV